MQVMPDPLEALFAKALGLEHFADAAQARKTRGGISDFRGDFSMFFLVVNWDFNGFNGIYNLRILEAFPCSVTVSKRFPY